MKRSANTYENSGSLVFRITSGIQQGLDALDELRAVRNVLAILGVAGTLYRFRSVLQGITSIEVLELSRLKFSEKISAKNLALSDIVRDPSRKINNVCEVVSKTITELTRSTSSNTNTNTLKERLNERTLSMLDNPALTIVHKQYKSKKTETAKRSKTLNKVKHAKQNKKSPQSFQETNLC